jgi:hypothetical protein
MTSARRSQPDAEYGALVELHTACTCARVTLSTASAASVSLAVGTYVVALYAPSGVAWATLGATATLPATGAAAQAAHFALRDGERIRVATASVLAAILTAGAGELALTLVT